MIAEVIMSKPSVLIFSISVFFFSLTRSRPDHWANKPEIVSSYGGTALAGAGLSKAKPKIKTKIKPANILPKPIFLFLEIIV